MCHSRNLSQSMWAIQLNRYIYKNCLASFKILSKQINNKVSSELKKISSFLHKIRCMHSKLGSLFLKDKRQSNSANQIIEFQFCSMKLCLFQDTRNELKHPNTNFIYCYHDKHLYSRYRQIIKVTNWKKREILIIFLHLNCTIVKGQMISKRFLVSSDSSKKRTNKFVFLA